ncbi:MAG: hypothetical protein ACREK8_09475 [Gemmatimonadales bacterium]
MTSKAVLSETNAAIGLPAAQRSVLFALHHRCNSLLEQLPPSASTLALGQELLQHGAAAYAYGNLAELENLYRQVNALAQSLGVERAGHINRRVIPDERAGAVIDNSREPVTRRIAAGPGLCGWGRRGERTASNARTREHAPLEYPWGKEPEPHPRSATDILPAKPLGASSAQCRVRIEAWRRSNAERAAAEWEAEHPPRRISRRDLDDSYVQR